jgi:protein-tyrosine-phosphatase/tRNA A37 threonylcarbamoyladenosine synthetase subunit TsaC/SUA5/YrdC
MPEVLDWQTVADPRTVIRRATRALRAGRVVVFPTESEYTLAASALRPEAVERLRAGASPLSVAVRGAGEARDWMPLMGPVALRLARRCWPGPITLAFGGADRGLARRLPDTVRPLVCPDNALRLRAPAHEAVLEVLRRLDVPLALAGIEADPDANLGGLVRSLEGSVTEELLRRQSACLVVFLCTGNTCRSPLAEALFKKRLADRLGCSPLELPARGYHILSAGLAAVSGGPAADEAKAVAATYCSDLSEHRSRPLTAELAAQADYLIAMTHGHAQALAEVPRLGCRPRLLRGDGQDVADPIGHPREVYEECGRQIWTELGALASEIALEAANQ